MTVLMKTLHSNSEMREAPETGSSENYDAVTIGKANRQEQYANSR